MRTEGLKRGLLSALMIISLILFVSPIAYAQGLFSVSPGEFTVNDVPVGILYHLGERLVIRNGDNINRTFALSVEAPPAGEVSEGYSPIPDPDWLNLVPSSTEIEENSVDVVEMWLNIPAGNELTNQRWEAWISVARQPGPGEIITLEQIVRAKIETASTSPPPPIPEKLLTALTIHPESFTLQVRKAIILTATLTQNGNPVAGGAIVWSATAGSFTNPYTLTDSTGQTKATYVTPEYEIPVTVTVSYLGSLEYLASNNSSQGTITAPPAGISMELVIAIAIVIGCAIIGATVIFASRRTRQKKIGLLQLKLISRML